MYKYKGILLSNIILLLLCAMFLIACPGFVDLQQEKQEEIQSEMGVFYLKLNDVEMRAIAPDSGLDHFKSYKLIFINAADFTDINSAYTIIEEVNRTAANVTSPVLLKAGNYILRVLAYTDENYLNLAAEGISQGFEISVNASTIEIVELFAFISEGGIGVFKWNISVPAGLNFNSAELRITSYTNINDVLTINLLNPSGQFNGTGSRNLNNGYYRILLSIIKDESSDSVILRSFLHIYRNMESVLEAEFEAGHFSSFFVQGDGTPGKPFILNNTTIQDFINDGWNLNAHYILSENIVLPSVAAGGSNWEPIGSEEQHFQGTFDGNGFSISGVKINLGDDEDIGLFGTVGASGVVKNLSLINVDIIGYYYVGALAGTNRGLVDNCSASGNVSGDGDEDGAIGGLIGWSNGTVRNSFFTGNVDGEYGIGGLTGVNLGVIENNYTVVNVNGYEDVGGIVGTNFNIVENNFASGTIIGEKAVGGVVGFNTLFDSWTGKVKNCYFAGTVDAGIDSTWIGGIIGLNVGIVQNCFSIGDVVGDTAVGGIAGYNEDGIISNNIALNSLVASSYNMPNLIGRIISFGTGGEINNNFAFTDMNAKYNWNGSSGTNQSLNKGLNQLDGQDISIAQIKTRTAWETAGFTFNGSPWVWDNSGETMPRLFWETTGKPWPAYLQ